jgi:hypothetical protein
MRRSLLRPPTSRRRAECMKLKAVVLALAWSGSLATADAQEPEILAWETAWGKVTYTGESGANAVFDYPLPFGDNVGYLYIHGLSGEFGGPGPLEGYWSEPDVSHDDDTGDTLACPFAIIDDHGRTTRNWGRLIIAFSDNWFPTDFILMRGRCFEEPRDVIPGKLVR